MAILLDELNTATTKKIVPGVADLFFRNDPLLAFLKRNRYKVWTGGPLIQENYIFKPLKGGSYAKGANFDISQRQTASGLQFYPKFYQVNITENKEDLALIRGPEAAFDLVKKDLGTAALTMSAILSIALYHNGQAAARTNEINGLEEALTDGTNATVFTAAPGFTSYGQQSRSDVSPALNTPVGAQAANINGNITYHALEHSYQSCVYGEEHPVIGVTTNRGMGYINEQFQPQQRIDTIEPTIGYTGMKFKAATIVVSQYAPGQDGVNDADIGDYSSANMTTAGETFWWLNPGPEGDDAYIKLWFLADPLYQFGFSGFKVAQDNNKIAGQIFYGGNLSVIGARYMRALFGITG